MQVKNNPAGRLHDILESARHQSAKESARKAWAAVFAISPDDTGTLLRMLADLIYLAHEAKTSIQRLQGIDLQLHLRPFKRIEALLSQLNLDSSWEQWKSQIDETTLYGLQFGADQLSRISGFTQIADDDLTDVRQQLDGLINNVTDSSLPQEVKLLLLRNLEAIRFALIAYRVRGVEGLQEEIERSVGSVMMHQDQINKSGGTSDGRIVWGLFFEVIDRLNKLVSLARNSKELAAPAIQHLLTQLLVS